MLCYVTLRYVMLCYVVLCYVKLCFGSLNSLELAYETFNFVPNQVLLSK